MLEKILFTKLSQPNQKTQASTPSPLEPVLAFHAAETKTLLLSADRQERKQYMDNF